MKIKNDIQLLTLSAEVGISKSFLSSKIIRKCLDKGLIESESDFFGMSMSKVSIDSEMEIIDLYFEIVGFGYEFTIVGLQAFAKLTIIGDGDCPECGGKLEVFEYENHYSGDSVDQTVLSKKCIDCELINFDISL